MMHFLPVSDFPLFTKKIRLRQKFSKFYLFPKIYFDFYPPKFLMTVFSPWLQIFNFPPIFAVSVHSLCFGKIIIPPYFCKFPADFVKFTCFCILYASFVPPSLTMMHLCITQCTYWVEGSVFRRNSLGLFNPKMIGARWVFGRFRLDLLPYRWCLNKMVLTWPALWSRWPKLRSVKEGLRVFTSHLWGPRVPPAWSSRSTCVILTFHSRGGPDLPLPRYFTSILA